MQISSIPEAEAPFLQASRSPEDASVAHLAITWLLMIPMVFFASRGQFWFQNASTNNALIAKFSDFAGKGYTSRDLLIELSVYSLVIVLIFTELPHFKEFWRRHHGFIALSALTIASCIWSQFPMRSIKYSVYFTLDTLFAFYLCRRFTPERQLRLLLLVGWVSLLLSLFMVFFMPFYGLEPTGSGAWRGIYAYKNACAMITAFLLPAAVYASADGPLTRLARIVYVGLTIYVVANNQSATGWVLLIAILLYVSATEILRHVHRTDKLIAMILGIGVAVPIIVAGYSNLKDILALLGKDPTLTGRTEIWAAVLPSILKRPILGYGYEAFWRETTGEIQNVAARRGGIASGSHNGFLDIWLSLGAVGFALVLYLFIRAFRQLFIRVTSGASSCVHWCGCIIVMTVVVNLDERGMMVPSDLIWIMFVMACVGLADEVERNRSELTRA